MLEYVSPPFVLYAFNVAFGLPVMCSLLRCYICPVSGPIDMLVFFRKICLMTHRVYMARDLLLLEVAHVTCQARNAGHLRYVLPLLWNV